MSNLDNKPNELGCCEDPECDGCWPDHIDTNEEIPGPREADDLLRAAKPR